MLAYALLLQKEFQAAAPVLSDLYQRSTPDPQEILPVLEAWAQVETGRYEEAARLLQRNPVPNISPEMSVSARAVSPIAFPARHRARQAGPARPCPRRIPVVPRSFRTR